ncbi:MAG: helix-turn-helix domain-containing protein [Gemmatimonadaceae bacterium]|nr:helix-turn-helix domain-containing protein [Gemmatimonadaceae bacterium]
MLTRDEQLRLDAAGTGLFQVTHRECVEDVLRDLRQLRARAVVVSTAFCQYTEDMTRVARVVREFPQVPTVALISQLDRGTARAVLTLGQCGIRTLIDVREPSGWRELRNLLLSEHSSELRQLAVAHVAADLISAPAGARRFFEVLFAVAPRTGTIRELASGLQVLPSTLMSRFFRAQLPPPKRILAYARLIFAARLFENPGLSMSTVAIRLDYSSSQSFGRHIRTTLGLTGRQFRDHYDGRGMLQRFRDDLIARYRQQWLTFDPMATGRGAWRTSSLSTTTGRGLTALEVDAGALTPSPRQPQGSPEPR